METICPSCGAQLVPGETCREQFDSTQVMELENPATFGTVHHLSVPCYMLQHNVYSREGWLWTCHLLWRFVYDGLTPAQTRRQSRNVLDSGQRMWSVTKGDKLREVDNIVWTRTIADVRTGAAEYYCADVRTWAVAMLADTEQLTRKLGNETV